MSTCRWHPTLCFCPSEDLSPVESLVSHVWDQRRYSLWNLSYDWTVALLIKSVMATLAVNTALSQYKCGIKNNTVTWRVDLSDVLLKVVTLLDDLIHHSVHSQPSFHVPTDQLANQSEAARPFCAEHQWSYQADLWMRCCASVNTSGLASTSRDCPKASLSWANWSWLASASRGDPIFSAEKSWDCFWRSCFQASISPVTCKTQRKAELDTEEMGSWTCRDIYNVSLTKYQ